MTKRNGSSPGASRGAWLAGGGGGAALFGLLASSCCALPVLLFTLGLGSAAAGLLPWLAAWRLPMLALALALLAIAWWQLWRAAPLACAGPCRPASAPRRSFGLMLALSLSSLLLLLALVWPLWLEPHAMRWLR